MIVTLPDGTCIRASSLLNSREGESAPSFGLYMDPRWRPSWPAEVIPWPDLGLPADGRHAALQIQAAYARAAGGEIVEIGCFAGLGRTGTVMACMAVLAGVAAKDAVGWVRSHYDSRAVETRDQEDWVLWFAGQTCSGFETTPAA